MDTNNPKMQNSEEGASFDYKKLINRFLINWPLFLVSLLVFGSAGLAYKRYATPNYKIAATILVEPDAKSGGAGAMSSMGGAAGGLSSLTDVSSLLGIPNNAENEVEILKSRSLISEVVKDLNLNVIIYRNGTVKKTELFDEAPFDIKIIYKTDSVDNRKFSVDLDHNVIHIKNSKDNIDLKTKMGQTISLPQYNLIFIPKNNPVERLGYTVIINSEETTQEELSKALDIDLTSKTTTTIDLSLNYPNSKKGEAILNKIMEIYLKANKENKVEIADSTLAFIDQRLNLVGKELEGVEKNFEEFRKQNNIADVDEQSKALIGAGSDIQKQLSTFDVQISVINNLKKYLDNPNNKRIIPADALGTDNQSFADVVGRYNELLLERDRQSMTSTEKNPYIITLDTQIENFREIIIKNINSYLQALQISRGNVEKQNSQFNSKIGVVPSQAKVFLDYTRQQTVKEQLYIFLLQTREETAISKTSTLSTARIIDSAKSDYLPITVKINLIAVLFILFGFAAPLIFLSLREFLNIKVVSKSELEGLTATSIVGEISHNASKNNVVVSDNSRTIISEQFRSLRTNLQYLVASPKPQVIVLTSSMSGEGKSFISVNMGSAIALSGKKVVFLELDLRKPKLSENLGLSKQNGFTDFILSGTTDIDSFIKPTAFSENIFIVSSGAIPPNPSELLLSDKLGILIEKLKEKFDYIIIDSAPVGLVSDVLLIEKYADITLYIVRQKYTYKSQLSILNDLVASKKLKKAYLVMNDIEFSKGGYYGYGYGYGYGYNSYDLAYGIEADKKTRLLGWFKKPVR